MGEGQEQQYVAQLRDVFDSFDTAGCGSLSQDELTDLCVSLHLQDAAPGLIQTLLLEHDDHTARVDFEQFKNALILVLSSAIEQSPIEQEPPPQTTSPEIQPKFVKGSKRYGRRSTPEFIEPVPDLCQSGPEEDQDESYEPAVPCKRERWNAHETSTGEEYEADGQLHLWNPDEPSTPRCSVAPLSEHLEQRVQEACELLGLSWDGLASHNDLLALSERLGLEVAGEVLQTLNCDEEISVQEFVFKILSHNKPPTPSASTPYRQLKRMHSTQPFDEGGRRITAPLALSGTIGLRLFSTLDDGTGFTLVEHVLDTWLGEGIENSAEILQALNFSLEGKLSLSDLTVALENELLVSKSGVLQAALASFKSEIRHLLASLDRELREKEKIQSDLEKAERLKTQLATEVDEHHSAIEHMNKVNLRKLEQEHKEKLSLVRSELMKEMDSMTQVAGAQREELEAEIHKIREDESFLRDHLSISVKENRRLEMELLDTAEKLVEAENQITKVQKNMDNIMKEKFGDLDPGSAEFFLQEERIKQLHMSYEAQCRDLQDRIDELQSEINEFHSIGRVHPTSSKSLSEELELESQSPGNESDPGIGAEEVQPFSLSLEAEMMLERLKDQHLQEMDELRNQLENKICEFEEIVENQRTSHEEQKKALAQQHREELQALRGEMSQVQTQAEELQRRLEQAQVEERKELETLQEEEIQTLRQQLLEAHIKNADLDEQLRSLEVQQSEISDGFNKEIEELKQNHVQEISKLVETQAELYDHKMEEERSGLLKEYEKEKDLLRLNFESEVNERLGQDQVRFENEKEEIVQRLTEQWQKERTQLDEQNTENLQVLLEEEMLKMVKEHEEKESKLREQWEKEKTQIQQKYEGSLIERLQKQTVEFEQREKKLRDEWKQERAQLVEDFEGMVQERVGEEAEKLAAEREEEERRYERLMEEERERIRERHRETVRDLTQRHQEEREELSSTLDKLKEDITLERRQIETGFIQRLKDVEERFTADQETMAERFQTDVSRLEQHYQNELKTMCEKHSKEKRQWEEDLQTTLENAEELRRSELERERMKEELTIEMQEIENAHKEEIEALELKNRQLRSELEELVRRGQLREVELSQQLSEFHKRLQESLDTREELVTQAQTQAYETEQTLREAVRKLQEEKDDALQSQSELEAKYKETICLSEEQIAERIELLTERDDLKCKIEQLELLMNKINFDFEFERKQMQETICDLDEKLKVSHQEGNGDELLVERNLWMGKIKELEIEASQVLNFVQKVEINGIEEEEMEIVLEEMGNFNDCNDMVSNPTTQVSDSTKSCSSLEEDTDALETPVDVEMDENECGLSELCRGQDDNMASGDYFANHLCEQQSAHCEKGTDINEFREKGVLCSSVHDPDSTWCPDQKPHCGDPRCENKLGAVSLNVEGENDEGFSWVERSEGANAVKDGNTCMNKAFCELQPQNLTDLELGKGWHDSFSDHEAVVDSTEPEDTDDLGQWLDEARSDESSVDLLMPEIVFDHFDCTSTNSESQNVLQLKALHKTSSDENILLHEKVSLLQQKIQILEVLLSHNNEKLKTGHLVLEENYSLKVKLLLFMEHIKELERKAFKMAELQIRYEDCTYENDKLKEQNAQLEKHVWTLESQMNIHDCFQDDKGRLTEEISQMRKENRRLSELLELDGGNWKTFTAMKQDVLDFNEVQGVIHLEDRCFEFEKQNNKLRRAITDLQGQSQIMTVTTKVHRSEACRLSEENMILKQKIDALKEEDLKEMTKTLETLKKEKDASQRAADDFKKQISALQSQSQLLENKNGILSEKNSQQLCDVEALRQQVASLMENKEHATTRDKTQMALCVSALEEELKKALGESETLKQRNLLLTQEVNGLREKTKSLDSVQQHFSDLLEEKKTVLKETQVLRNQLTKAQEKAKASDENLQTVTLQSSRLKADVRVLQQQKDSLQHEVTLMNKKLQNANDKTHVLERALHSTGLQSHSKKLLREELARLMEQEQKLLKQENDKLQAEVVNVKGDLRQTREKVRQLDSVVVNLKQQKQSMSSKLLNIEQENLTLKEELEAQKEKNKGREAGAAVPDLESVLQENEVLKSQMARLSSQLIETFQAQLVGLLPPSPHRTPRGQQREEAENMQNDRERKMKNMEERMKEIEMSLHNVKLLLKEKVVQLQEQLHKNGKADVLIKDLYSENEQLLQALEVTEQRHKIAEKKNYLLEEKISSLTKILRDLGPSSLPTLQYHFTCS